MNITPSRVRLKVHTNGVATSEQAPRFNSWTLMLSLAAPYRKLIALMTVTLLCDMIGMLCIPTQLSYLINIAITTRDLDAFAHHALLMLLFSFMGSGGYITSTFLASRLASQIARDLRQRIYTHSLGFSSADFNAFGSASMISRMVSDINVIQQVLLQSVLMVIPVPLMCLISIYLAYSTDVFMGHVLLAVAIAVTLISLVAVKVTTPLFVYLQTAVDKMNTHLRESIVGMRVIRAFNTSAKEMARLNHTFEDYAQKAIRVGLIFAITDSLTFCVMNLVEALIMWLGAERVGAGAIGVGSISALIEYAILILFFIMMAQFTLMSVPRALACLRRAVEVLNFEPEIVDPESQHSAVLPEVSSDEPLLAFDQVSLRYQDADEQVLQSISFELKKGQQIALVGPVGSGKSSILKLILRLCSSSEGSIRFAGIDTSQLTQKELRARISYIPQKAWLFAGTIRENLLFAAPDATEEDMLHALTVAQADFVFDLPEGLDSPVSQGATNFSGGQRQRLCIARGLLRKADLYILDDATSALDYKTDAHLRAELARELADKAVLIVTQRVATTSQADEILMLQDGQIIGRGAHEELLTSCTAYANLVQSQISGACK